MLLKVPEPVQTDAEGTEVVNHGAGDRKIADQRKNKLESAVLYV